MGPLTTWTDGGLATTLQRRGLPPATPVESWLALHPAEIAAAHEAFVEAGAGIVLAATFRSLPSVDPGWAQALDRALAVALQATRGRAAVWAAFGSWSVGDRRWSDLSARERPRIAEGWAFAASAAMRLGAKGIVLETFVDPEELLVAAREIRAQLPDAPLVACLVPRPDGALVSGAAPGPAVEQLRAIGVTGVGFNCGWGPEGVERALDRCEGIEGPWWAKPAAGGIADEEVVRALVRLAGRCAWVGGCCGVPPEVLAAAVAAVRPPGVPT